MRLFHVEPSFGNRKNSFPCAKPYPMVGVSFRFVYLRKLVSQHEKIESKNIVKSLFNLPCNTGFVDTYYC